MIRLESERTFNTYDGREITVSGGNYGWQIDQKAELKELTELIKNGETQVREPVYSHEGLVRKTNDIGNTYIEIDLTAQRMVFYKDGTPTADAQIVSLETIRAPLCNSCGVLYNR